jgi:NAD(P)-dependent dehydrogenase (short-subunit alcohol dehydrogenase family)
MVFNRFTLEGKIALVTGAGRGLGQPMAIALAQAGAAVVAAAGTEREVQETADAVCKLGRKGIALPLNVNDSHAVDRTVEHVVREMGSVDILVNNAGGEVGRGRPVAEMSDEEWSQTLTTNLTSAFYCTRAAGRQMLTKGWGRVINIACLSAVRGSVNHSAYAAAKGGLLQFTQALALEWAEHGVTVNSLGFGWFEGQQGLQTNPDVLERLKRAIPARRLGLPTDVEALLVYLASDASRYLTGQNLWLDGGILCR